MPTAGYPDTATPAPHAPAHHRRRLRSAVLLPLALSLTLTLTACDPFGLGEQAATAAAAKEADGRAIGSACRHSGRALEDCYRRNAKASKAANFTGWRDMDAYMRENKIEVVTPSTDAAPVAPAEGSAAEHNDANTADKSQEKNKAAETSSTKSTESPAPTKTEPRKAAAKTT